MKRLIAVWTCVLVLASWSTRSSGDPPTAAPVGKTVEFHTALPPSQSPRLSAAQLAKQASAPTTIPAAPAQAARTGMKTAPLTTALPPRPGAMRDEMSLAGKRPTPFQGMQERNLTTMLGLPQHAALAVNPTRKPAPIMTALPPDPKLAGAHSAAMARKLSQPRPGATASVGRKPAPLETRSPVPTTLSPEQLAKRAQANDAGARRPQ